MQLIPLLTDKKQDFFLKQLATFMKNGVEKKNLGRVRKFICSIVVFVKCSGTKRNSSRTVLLQNSNCNTIADNLELVN